jgi:hypothetical protein
MQKIDAINMFYLFFAQAFIFHGIIVAAVGLLFSSF